MMYLWIETNELLTNFYFKKKNMYYSSYVSIKCNLIYTLIRVLVSKILKNIYIRIITYKIVRPQKLMFRLNYCFHL
jgi:hypothetical protein